MAEPASYRGIDALLAEHARRWGDRVYVEGVAPRARLTFGELDAASARLAHFLADRGVKAQDRISVLSSNCLEWLILFFGVQRYGAAVHPINVEVNAKNVAQMLHDVEPRLVLWNRAIPEELQALVGTAGDAAIPFDALFAALDRYPAAPRPRPAGDPRAIAIIDYTSGTTVTPRGVLISHEAYFYMARSLVERLGITDADRILESRALSWASPQCLSVGPTLQTGATLILAPRFSRRRFFEWIREYEVTIAAGVPTVFHMLLAQPVPVTGAELPALRFITGSAAPLPAARQVEFERRYRIPIVQGCGMTEAGFMGANPPAARRLGSIGPAVPHLEARFVDDTGVPCPPGQPGELVVGGRQMASAYLTDRDTLVEIPRDGFRTGDLGYADADGYLYLTGRKKDLIIRGGVNIAPMEITSTLLAHPAVAEAVTIGVPDEVYGEGIVSFVALHAGEAASPDELLAHCRTRLSAFKLPQQILVVEALPKTERGKLARGRLEALWREQTARGPDPGPRRAASG